MAAERDRATSVPTSLGTLFRLWGLEKSLNRYFSRGLAIEELYAWQARCLAEPGVAGGSKNLLYFAPTSGGKTLVAELLMLLRIMNLPDETAPGAARTAENSRAPLRRAIVVLPFISMVTEKVKHLLRVVAPYNRGRPKRQRIKVRALYGSRRGRGLGGREIAVCTIEKANSLVNKMAAADELHELSCLVLDELHMIGEGVRGQTLELILTKVLCASRPGVRDPTKGHTALSERGPAAGQINAGQSSSRGRAFETARLKGERSDSGDQDIQASTTRTQIIGMSATLSNGAELAAWLGACLHVSDFRPIPLDERLMLGMNIFDKAGKTVRRFSTPAHPESDPDHVVTLCRESCLDKDQVIIFCSTKQFCHNCALKVARHMNLQATPDASVKRSALLAQLAKETSVGVDSMLQATIPHGVAFHHAGLADTERALIETAFRAGTLAVLTATSTLGAGVNLPAGRVILRNLNAVGGGLSATSYRQMAGRAGRKGAGRARGEALLVAANEGQAARARLLMNAGLAAVKSALTPNVDGGEALTRMVLEGVCGGLVRRKSDVAAYVACSLFFHQLEQQQKSARDELMETTFAALEFLIDEACVEVVARPDPDERQRFGQDQRSRSAQPLPKRSKLIHREPVPGDESAASAAREMGFTSDGVGDPDGEVLVPTKLGWAIFRSSLGPAEGLTVYRDLSESKNGINLRNTLHLAYLLTPLSPPSGLKPDWERLRTLHSQAKAAAAVHPPARGAELVDDFRKVGITESHLHLWASRGPSSACKRLPLLSAEYVSSVSAKRLADGANESAVRGTKRKAMTNASEAARNAVRLVAAMALKDVSDGHDVGQVAKAYGMSRGDLQNLRKSTATFSSMVASFLKELGWTMFLMLVKGFIPRLSLGVSNDLLPLMQVPGLTRTEAGALYRGGILTAKHLLAAPDETLANALRLNVPFRTRRRAGHGWANQGSGEVAHFKRRAWVLKTAARDIDEKRKKGNKAQALKLLQVVQQRLGQAGENIANSETAELCGISSLVRVAPRARSHALAGDPLSCEREHGGTGNLGETGISDNDDDADESDGADDASDSGEEDGVSVAVHALLSGCTSDESDHEEEEHQTSLDPFEEAIHGQVTSNGMSPRAALGSSAASPVAVAGILPLLPEDVPRPSTSRDPRERSFMQKKQQFPPGAGGTNASDAAAGRPRGTVVSGTPRFSADMTACTDPSSAHRKLATQGLSTNGLAKVPVGGRHGNVEKIDSCSRTSKGNVNTTSRKSGASTKHPLRAPEKVAPADASTPERTRCAEVALTDGVELRGEGLGSKSASGTPIRGAWRSSQEHRTLRTPSSTPPEAGSPTFLYEAETLPGTEMIRSSNQAENDDAGLREAGEAGAAAGAAAGRCAASAKSSPAIEACRSATSNVDGRGHARDVFAGGTTVIHETAAAWRGAPCFSFVLGSRSPPTGALSSARPSSYRRSWEPLLAKVPALPYTVPSAGESFVPLSRHEADDTRRVVSGIAFSFDSKTSHYLRLPPLLPRRSAGWRHVRHDVGQPRGTYKGGGDGDGNLNGRAAIALANDIGRGAMKSGARASPKSACGVVEEEVTACWDAAPRVAVEAVTLFVGFPWLCADCGTIRTARCYRHAIGGYARGMRERVQPWNQVVLVCRRWNALGVDALNAFTAGEPARWWTLARDIMRNEASTKVSLHMKEALVCLRHLSIDVRGPLEDPAVAKWLADPPVDEAAFPRSRSDARTRTRASAPPRPQPSAEGLTLPRKPKSSEELWRLQAAATLSLMAHRERTLEDLSLSVAFYFIEMPAVRAAAMMEYAGLGVRAGMILNMRRDVDLKLRDLESVAAQLLTAGGEQAAEREEKTSLASPKRVHDFVYVTLGVKPPTSWSSSSGAGSASRAGASKKASRGPTDTNSLLELLRESRADKRLSEEARTFIEAVVQHRALAPATRSLGGLLARRTWHPHLGGYRVNPSIDLLTSTGRMITSDPPLQNLDHKIRLQRSWRLSLAEEMEADVPEIEVVPRVRADDRSSGDGILAAGGLHPVRQPSLSQEAATREALSGIVPKTNSDGDATTMNFGEIVSVVEDRCVQDPIHVFRELPRVRQDTASAEEAAAASTESMASFWQKRGYPYTSREAERTRQVMVRLGSSRGSPRGGGNGNGGSRAGKIYSYPADKVFRIGASFLSSERAASLLVQHGQGEGGGDRNPWFQREALLRPREALTPSKGYVFVSADYSQIEMRLMAHLSGDPDLLSVFGDGGDVFRAIAAALSAGNKSASDVTDEDRRQSKLVVYGVLYGQSAEALAPQLGVSRPQAWKIRETVLKRYPRLRDFLAEVKSDCKTCGYVETLLGRRRYLPHINSGDPAERARAERQAANTVCQGSAADLLKLAATNVAARLQRCHWMSTKTGPTRGSSESRPPEKPPCRFPDDERRSEIVRNPACRLVLSIHDELVYEVLEPYAADVANMVKACMEGACALSVPLVANPRIGDSWGSMSIVCTSNLHQRG